MTDLNLYVVARKVYDQTRGGYGTIIHGVYNTKQGAQEVIKSRELMGDVYNHLFILELIPETYYKWGVHND